MSYAIVPAAGLGSPDAAVDALTPQQRDFYGYCLRSGTNVGTAADMMAGPCLQQAMQLKPILGKPGAGTPAVVAPQVSKIKVAFLVVGGLVMGAAVMRKRRNR